MLFGPENLGATIDLTELAAPRLDALLFGESQGRVIVAVKFSDQPALVVAARAAGIPADAVGAVAAAGTLTVKTARGTLSWDVPELRLGWEGSIETAMKRPGLG
jgi:phosphoribosylformylglycinamidine (FGAM) synthase-like enzyme